MVNVTWYNDDYAGHIHRQSKSQKRDSKSLISIVVTGLIFGTKAHLIDTHLLVPRSRSSAKVKVKYHGHVSQKMGVSGALVFHKHILFVVFVFKCFQFWLC